MISNDTARCAGIGDEEGFFEDCEECQRRTAPPSSDYQVWMMTPKIISFTCEYRIGPDK